jgi:hypothetical protein
MLQKEMEEIYARIEKNGGNLRKKFTRAGLWWSGL